MVTLAAPETIVVRPSTGHDARTGDPAEAAEPVQVPGCAVWPVDANGNAANESTGLSDVMTSGYQVLAPPGTAIRTTDRVVLRGLEYEVVGEPAVWRSQLTGREPGVLVTLRRGTG